MTHPTYIINDVHLGVNRTGGTTPRSAAALRAWQMEQLAGFLAQAHGDIIVNGDLFDEFNAPMTVLLDTYTAFAAWLEAHSYTLVLAAGNHDLSKDSSRLSSLQFLGQVLSMQFGDRVRLLTEPAAVGELFWVIPHIVNQEQFDERLKEVPPGVKYVLLHANYDNHFAQQTDHSLNVTDEQSLSLTRAGHHLIFGHEHAKRQVRTNLTIVGNQWPTSVSDCLDEQDKVFALVDAAGNLQLVPVWDRSGFAQIPWDHLAGCSPQAQFIRVVGNATAEQAADVVSAISKFRQRSDAFVVTNAVKVEGAADMAEVAATLDEITEKFDVLQFLFDQLEPHEVTILKGLLASQDAAQPA